MVVQDTRRNGCSHPVDNLRVIPSGRLYCKGCRTEEARIKRGKQSRKDPNTNVPDKREDFSTYYPDKGCEASNHCLECSLPQCKYDDPKSFHLFKRRIADERSVALMASCTMKEAAVKAGVTLRTMFRIKARSKKATWALT